jgi:hypothetical protein
MGAALLIPALVLTGCSKKKSSSDSGSSSQPTQASGAQATKPAATTAASSGGGSSAAADELTALFTNFLKVKSFRAAITEEVTGQPKVDGSIEYVAPDKYHITLPGLGEFINIGKDSYIKIGPAWTKSPGAGGGSLFDAASIQSTLDSFKNNSKKGGTDTVNGVKCQIYTVTDTSGSTTEVCVANGLPVRMVIKSTSSTTTFVFTDFDKLSDIKAPI